ncbi:hypothetical protein P4I85_29280 [Bacillus cereus]|nr:hypothetical protein [Bacillus thuringiensis]MDA2153066.1 hypothetical protein [Bacillus cereus]OUB81222.1 hypothetical protein BK744_00795 [Bacillus thuringiensis serovar zhaodongensis]MDA2561852.1 hypothetical protein [Bacillus cereus]MDA2615984.1 hypothetical protein [Bacillus cereus]MEB9163938.1 hypothetical protein [Bacillus cereus]
MSDKMDRYYERVAKHYGLETIKEGGALVRLHASIKALSKTASNIEDLTNEVLQKVINGESVAPKESK